MEKYNKIRKYLSPVVILIIALAVFTMFRGGGGPVKYDAAVGAPYEGLYEADKMDSSGSYSDLRGANEFSVKMQWKTKDETIDHAELTDEYYLEWSADEHGIYALCEPDNDMSALRDVSYTIKPGDILKLELDVDSYFDGLPRGYYRFVKVMNVVRTDGASERQIVHFDFDLYD